MDTVVFELLGCGCLWYGEAPNGFDTLINLQVRLMNFAGSYDEAYKNVVAKERGHECDLRIMFHPCSVVWYHLLFLCYLIFDFLAMPCRAVAIALSPRKWKTIFSQELHPQYLTFSTQNELQTFFLPIAWFPQITTMHASTLGLLSSPLFYGASTQLCYISCPQIVDMQLCLGCIDRDWVSRLIFLQGLDMETENPFSVITMQCWSFLVHQKRLVTLALKSCFCPRKTALAL